MRIMRAPRTRRGRIMRRTLIAVLASFNLIVGGVGSYALYTRVGAPSFQHGGPFGAPEAPHASRPTSARAPAAPGAHASTAARTTTNAARTTTTAKGAPKKTAVSGIALPRPGTYRFAGSGHETIRFGGGSPCSWDVRDVGVVVHAEAGSQVFDWTYAPERQQRNIFSYRSDGIYTTFVGAAVTCVIRKTDNEEYDRPVIRIQVPLKLGARWHAVAHSASRTEDFTGEVIAHRRFTVPAGAFDAYELHFLAKISGNQSGTFESHMWFAPSLGIEIASHQVTDVEQSSAHFTSDISFQLAALPS